MKFSAYPLDAKIIQNLSALKFFRPTDIQFKTIPHILRGEDILAVAQTGTGKTAAYLIPVLQSLIKSNKKTKQNGVRALVMVPTHELAIQVDEVFKKISKGSGVSSMAIYGGIDQFPQIEQLQLKTDLVIATPGRMFDLRSQGALELDKVTTLILDEADLMLKKGFLKDIKDLIRYLPKRKQTLFFSATIDRSIKKQAYELIHKNAIRIQISPNNPVAKNIYHQTTRLEMEDKRFFLERIVRENHEAKIIAFVRTKVRAERVKKAMERVNIQSLSIHSDKSQLEREDILKDFKTGKTKLLIATDVSARGVDIPNVDIVVNYDIPDIAENYVHRVGRTGRGKNKGYAISFCSETEIELLEDIEFYLGAKIEEIEIDRFEYQNTLDFSKDSRGIDWKTLTMKAIEADRPLKKKKKKK